MFLMTPGYFALAQSSGILVDMVPANPSPYEEVSITLSSYSSNLDSVLITWSVNGRTASSGTGKKSFSVKAAAAGSEIIVVATVSLPAGTTETRIIIRPAVMSLLWQANDSYVPPFYKGKALPTPDSEVKVVAMPGVSDPKNMTYSWKKDYTNDGEASGYGKQSFLYTNDYLENSNNVSVTASTIDQKFTSEASIDIGTWQPKILFYKNDSALGTLFEKALADSHRIEGKEILVAVPYFISPEEIRTPSLIFNWFINDSQVSVSDFRKNVMPLVAQSGVSGTSKLRLEIENTNRIFQSASKEINLEF